MTTLSCRTIDNSAKLTESLRLTVTHKSGKALAAKLALPEKYESGKRKLNFKWELRRFEQKKNSFFVLFSDEKAGFVYSVSVSARRDIKGPVEYSGKLTNISANPVRVFPGTLFQTEFKFDEAPTIWRFMKESGVAEGVKWSKGDFYREGTGIYKDVLTDGKTVEAETNTNQDWNVGGVIPLVYFDGGDKGAYVGVEWTSHRIMSTGTKNGVYVTVDYHDGFTTIIPSGESLDVAPVYVGIYTGDVDDGSNEFKRWFFEEKVPANVRDDENEPLTQIDPQIAPADCADHGIQSIKWDYGWWSNKKLTDAPDNGIWSFYEGSWKLRNEGMINYVKRYGFNSLEEYGEYMEKLGLNWTIYVLLHDSQCELEDDDLMTSVGKNGHPEWFSSRKIAGKCPVADLGNKECVEYAKRKLCDFFVRTKVKGWRSDFEPIANWSDKQNRHDANGNDVQYWCSKGFFEIVDYLIENVPNFRYESCCSGGAMKDFATLRRTTVFNNDDSADYVSLRTTFYDSSYCLHPVQIQSPLDPMTFAPESKNYAGIGDKDFGFRSTLTQGIMYSCWGGPQGDILEGYKKYAKLHNEKVKPLIRHANLYHILPRPDNIHWDGVQYGCDFKPKNGIAGISFVFKPTNEEGKVKHIPVRGLNPKFNYSVEFFDRTEQNFTATGKELMEKGIDVRIEQDMGSEMIFYVVK